MNTHIYPRIQMLRAAIGIESMTTTLSNDDYFELYQFDPPQDYEHFKQSCNQVKARWPTRQQFEALNKRYDEELFI